MINALNPKAHSNIKVWINAYQKEMKLLKEKQLELGLEKNGNLEAGTLCILNQTIGLFVAAAEI